MDKVNLFVGIDISKLVFDVSLTVGSKPLVTQFANTPGGVKELIKWLKKHGAKPANTLICYEHTGIYCNHLNKYLHLANYKAWIEMAYRIKHSLGLQRGKNDKIDAGRIAEYAGLFRSKVELYTPSSAAVRKLDYLVKARDKCIENLNYYKRQLDDIQSFEKEMHSTCKNLFAPIIKGLEKSLKDTNAEIDECLKDEDVKPLFKSITSVVGVGRITAIYLIVYTKGFSKYKDPRKLACYCGVAPFEHTSGKSVRKKPRVHHMANKRMKSLLHLCAMTAIQHDTELRAYYERKVGEHKNKMVVLNNVRNKLIHRIMACVTQGKIFEKRTQPTQAQENSTAVEPIAA